MENQELIRSAYVRAIEMTLQRQYVAPYAPKSKVDLPLIPRPCESELKSVIDSHGVFLLYGPSYSGKSYYLKQLLNGRSATVFISGNEIGNVNTEAKLLEGIADAFGCGSTLTTRGKGAVRFFIIIVFVVFEILHIVHLTTLSEVTIQWFLGMVKETLQLKSVAKLSPLLIFDNVEKLIENGKVRPEAIDFLTWCQEMTNLRLMNFVMISSDPRVRDALQERAPFFQLLG